MVRLIKSGNTIETRETKEDNYDGGVRFIEKILLDGPKPDG